jgi:choline dehydrogenase
LKSGYLDEYLRSASGPFSSAAGFLAAERLPTTALANLTAATRTKLANYPDDWPHLTFIVGSFPGPNLVTIGTVAAYAPLVFSRGNLTIRSADMRDAPVISPNWLSDPADAELAVAAVKRLRVTWATDAANAIKAGPELFPGEDVQTDAQILEYVRANANPIWHASSSCAMGKEADVSAGKAVVDSAGRVFGVKGLRVADASAFPFGMPGHPQAAVYALAEKIGDAIKGDLSGS